MRGQEVLSKEFEFYFPEHDTLLLVEPLEDGSVVIRATRDTFSETRKIFFVHQLANEGFIPDQYQWFSGESAAFGLKWVIDCSWLKLHPEINRRANRLIRRLLFWTGTLWLAMMLTLLFPGTTHSAKPNVGPNPRVAPPAIKSVSVQQPATYFVRANR